MSSARTRSFARKSRRSSRVKHATTLLYEDYKYKLPVDLAIGGRAHFLSTDAYTASYASVSFNGLAPLKTYIRTLFFASNSEGNARDHQKRTRPLDRGEAVFENTVTGRHGDNRDKIDEH